ncbi:MAG: aryl-sulfate sulfotransferase [Nonlabens sp.]
MSKNFIFIFLIALIGCSDNDVISKVNVVPDDLNPAVTAYDPERVVNDFILVSPMRTDTTFLLNRSGQAIKKWHSESGSVFMAYLLEDGGILRNHFSTVGHDIDLPGRIDKLEIRDKSNQLQWEWRLDRTDQALHHDLAILPNGNILASVWEIKDRTSCIQNGRNPNSMFDDRLIFDKIIEIQPIGSNQANIVWEWNMWDHLIQDYDINKINYARIQDNPDKIDINLGAGGENFSHVNSLHYIEQYDQIVLSSRVLSEFFIIDHSTTTEQASTGTGGNYGKGGSILSRWGSPSNVTKNDNDMPIFQSQHDASYVGDFNTSRGNFLVFNNITPLGTSSVKEVNIPMNLNGEYLPIDFSGTAVSTVWNYENSEIYSRLTSGVQRLPSGTSFITSNNSNIMREVDYEGNIIWEYNIDFENPEFDRIESSGFKARVYSKNYSGVVALDLSE